MPSGTHKPLVRRFPSLRWPRAAAMIVAAALFGVLALQPQGPVQADTVAQLKAAQRKLNALIAHISSEEKTIATDEQQANDLTVQIDHIQSDIARTQATIANLQQEIRKDIRQVHHTQGVLDDRARL